MAYNFPRPLPVPRGAHHHSSLPLWTRDRVQMSGGDVGEGPQSSGQEEPTPPAEPQLDLSCGFPGESLVNGERGRGGSPWVPLRWSLSLCPLDLESRPAPLSLLGALPESSCEAESAVRSAVRIGRPGTAGACPVEPCLGAHWPLWLVLVPPQGEGCPPLLLSPTPARLGERS